MRPGQGGDLRDRGEDVAVILRDREREAAFSERLRKAADPYRCDKGPFWRFNADPPYEARDADVVLPSRSSTTSGTR